MTPQTLMTTTPPAPTPAPVETDAPAPETAELETGTAAAGEPDAETAAEAAAALGIRGAQLSDEETAAVVAVLARLAATEPVSTDAGGTGPTDRAIQRRHRLQLDQHGLWGRPGPSSWQAAGGIG